jgi:restriction system protein
VSPQQFEELIAELMRTEGSGLTNIRVQHGERLRGTDGEYAIDTTVRFRVLGGADLLVLVEAKLQNRPVERTAAQKLLQIVQSTGAHKGIVVSSSGFQRGALNFAGGHGIALVQLVDGQMTYVTRSVNSKPRFVPGLPEFVASGRSNPDRSHHHHAHRSAQTRLRSAGLMALGGIARAECDRARSA